MKNVKFLVVILMAIQVACGNAQPQMTMTLQPYDGKLKIYLGGIGTAIIDWGNGTIETHKLTVFDDEENFTGWGRFMLTYTYANEAVYTITITGKNITFLDCSDLFKLTNLDVSHNPALTYFDCSRNQLANLDVSRNTALTHLNASDNRLTNLDISRNTALIHLDVSDNQLINLDVSRNTALTELIVWSNGLTDMDVSRNIALTHLDCSHNHLTNLDVNSNTTLKNLDCRYNRLTYLDVSHNTVLKNLLCSGNQLTNLDVSRNTALTELRCGYNQLTNLDVSRNNMLREVSCEDNQLSAAALNALFKTLHNNYVDDDKIIFIHRNPGTYEANREIAERNGWRAIRF